MDYKRPQNFTDFAAQSSKAKSPIQDVVSQLVRATNKHKLDYNQLKFIFRSVRQKCGLKASGGNNKLVKLPTQQELEKFYKVIIDPVHVLIFETLEGTGLRVSELCNLKVVHLDFEAQTIFVEEGKGGRDRVTVFGGKLGDKLKLYLHKKNNTYLFESQRYSNFSSRRIQQLCSDYKKRAEIKTALTCHTFRHLWNTRLASNNISREVREILAGHAKGSKSQDIYTHLSVGGFKDEILRVLDSNPVHVREAGDYERK